jgi:hypothetical protein
MLFPTGRLVGIMGLGGLDEVVAHEDEHLFLVMSWASQDASKRRAHWDPGSLVPSSLLIPLFLHRISGLKKGCVPLWIVEGFLTYWLSNSTEDCDARFLTA